jgi:hypothetical protein
MDADLDRRLTPVYVTADDLLPFRPGNTRRSLTDPEVLTLCVAQAIMEYRRTGGSSLSRPSICVTCSQGSPLRPATTSAACAWLTRWSG